MDELYNDFSTVYDECDINEFSLKFGRSILKYFEDMHPNETFNKHLDLCCGTGSLCNLFKENGIETKGVDLSSGMLNVAIDKYPDIEFIHCDVTEYEDNETYDFITCINDSLNHITDEEKVINIIRNVNGCLRKDGLFIFDVFFFNMAKEGRYDNFVEGNKKLSYLIEIDGDMVKISTDYFEEGNLIWNDEVYEKNYPIERVAKILNDEGFTMELCSQSFYEETRPAKAKIIARKIN